MRAASRSTAARELPFGVQELGTAAGLWTVPLAGFEWSEGLRPVDAEIDDPGPWLVPSSPEGRNYAVLREERILRDFALLAQWPSMDAIRRFANRYGWLGSPTPVVTFDAASGTRAAIVTAAESLGSWLGACADFHHLRTLWEIVQVLDGRDSYGPERAREADALLRERIVHERIAGQEEGGYFRYAARVEYSVDGKPYTRTIADSTFAHVGTDGQTRVYRRLARSSLRDAARYYVYRTINLRLRSHIDVAALPFGDGAIRYFPDSLLAAIYLRWLFDMRGGKVQAECPRCHTAFPQTRRNQRFCSRRCKELARYHRRRAMPPT